MARSTRGSFDRYADRSRSSPSAAASATHGTLRAPVVAFEGLDELKSSPARLDGTIAFVNHRMPPYDDEHDDPGYRVGVQARLHAASEAAKRGAPPSSSAP